MNIPAASALTELLGADLAKKGLLKSQQGESRGAKVGPHVQRTVKHTDEHELKVDLQVFGSKQVPFSKHEGLNSS